VLSTKPEDLAVFEQIVIEYHNGYAELKRFLESVGFMAMIKPIRSVYQPIEKQGYVVARLRHQDKLKNLKCVRSSQFLLVVLRAKRGVRCLR